MTLIKKAWISLRVCAFVVRKPNPKDRFSCVEAHIRPNQDISMPIPFPDDFMNISVISDILSIWLPHTIGNWAGKQQQQQQQQQQYLMSCLLGTKKLDIYQSKERSTISIVTLLKHTSPVNDCNVFPRKQLQSIFSEFS